MTLCDTITIWSPLHGAIPTWPSCLRLCMLACAQIFNFDLRPMASVTNAFYWSVMGPDDVTFNWAMEANFRTGYATTLQIVVDALFGGAPKV